MPGRAAKTDKDRSPHTPMRTCVATRRQAPATELLRVVVDRDSGTLVPDPHRSLPGRGAWITPTLEAMEVALKRRAFERALKVSAPADAGRVREYLAELSTQDDAPTVGAHHVARLTRLTT